MSSNLISAPQLPNLLRDGVAVGMAGGLAEVIVVEVYCAATGASATNVARQIASAVGLDGASAWAGLAVHLILAAMLGVALTRAWTMTRQGPARELPLFELTLLMLTIVWAINFFIVLPVLSPGFVTLLPLSVTLVSKLMFGVAAAVTLRALSAGKQRKTMRANPAPPRLSGPAPRFTAWRGRPGSGQASGRRWRGQTDRHKKSHRICVSAYRPYAARCRY
jgi:hypothetical protein